MVHNFKKSKNDKLSTFKLVLPPWPHLYHWQSKDIFDQRRLPWSLFFDIPSLQKFAPVLEISDFFSGMFNCSNNLRPSLTRSKQSLCDSITNQIFEFNY